MSMVEVATASGTSTVSSFGPELPDVVLELLLRFLHPKPFALLGACSCHIRFLTGSVIATGAWALRWVPEGDDWGTGPADLALRWLADALWQLRGRTRGDFSVEAAQPPLKVVLDGCPSSSTDAVTELLGRSSAVTVSAVGCPNVMWQRGVELIDDRWPRVASAFGGRLWRLRPDMTGSFRCLNHYGIPDGSVHEYAPCGSFFHEGMRLNHGFVRRAVRPARPAALAAAGWHVFLLTYCYGSAAGDFTAPDIAASILIRDEGDRRFVCHSVSILENPRLVNHAVGESEDLERALEEELEQQLPDVVPEEPGLFNDVVLGEWMRHR